MCGNKASYSKNTGNSDTSVWSCNVVLLTVIHVVFWNYCLQYKCQKKKWKHSTQYEVVLNFIHIIIKVKSDAVNTENL